MTSLLFLFFLDCNGLLVSCKRGGTETLVWSGLWSSFLCISRATVSDNIRLVFFNYLTNKCTRTQIAYR